MIKKIYLILAVAGMGCSLHMKAAVPPVTKDTVQLESYTDVEQMLRPLEPTYHKGVFVTSPWNGNWFVSLQGGASAFIGKPVGCADLFDRIKPTISASLGKWFTPQIGARIGYGGWQFKDCELVTNDYHHFHADPYQALEESVTNSLYHRDYREWEPVVITVEPDSITIQNVGGPDRSISAADISRCEILVSKRYRNRRLGEYLKELDMTEGRSTGIPTIQNVLENNGSPRATVVTDEDRTFFRITIPCHEAAGNIIADIANKDASVKASRRGALKTALQTALQTAPETALQILEQIQINPKVTMTDLANLTGYSRRWVAQTMKQLQELNVIKRVGSTKTGYWEIIAK